jgi:transketolase
MAYLRTTRPKTPVIYGTDEQFPVGGFKVLRQSAEDVATVIGAGVTLFEALKAYDQLKTEGLAIRVVDLYSLQPIDAAGLQRAARETQHTIVTVEDHYAAGGIGDAVSAAVSAEGVIVHRLAVREIPRSGKAEELLERYGISASHIVQAVMQASRTRTSA